MTAQEAAALHNARAPFFARFPREIRDQIYKTVFCGQVIDVYDADGPSRPDFDQMLAPLDKIDYDDPAYNLSRIAMITFSTIHELLSARKEWERDKREYSDLHWSKTYWPGKQPNSSTPRNLDALLRSCKRFDLEAAPFFYENTTFRISCPMSDYQTARGFLYHLPQDRLDRVKRISIRGLQPCHPNTVDRIQLYQFLHGLYHEEFRERECDYRATQKDFVEIVAGKMSLKELTLGFDLYLLAGQFEMHHLTPHADWLRPLLQLSKTTRINIEFEDPDWMGSIPEFDPLEDVPDVDWLLDQLNHIDGQKMIRAKMAEDSDYFPNNGWYEHHEQELLEEEALYGPTYPHNNIWDG